MNFSLEKGEEIVKAYKNNKTNPSIKQKLLMELFEIIYVNLESFGVYFRDEDLRSDFVCKFYYRIPRLLENYKPELSSFYTYMTSHIRFYYLTFKCKNVRNEIHNAVIAKQEGSRLGYLVNEYDLNENFNFYAAEHEPSYCKDEGDYGPFQGSVISKMELEHRRALYFSMPCKHRRIFLLACKACFFLDDDLIEKISAEIKMDPEFLCCILQDLKVSCFKRLEKINYHICNRNNYYIKIQLFKYLLFNTYNTKRQFDQLCFSLKYNRYLWLKAQDLNRRQIKCPSSTDIGKCINVCKGTIDKNIAKSLKMWYTQKHENILGIGKYKQKKGSARAASGA
ncbi:MULTISPECIES: nucleoside-triphosphatase [unclassified Treponema]|uniref:nucleoside-triphosphatase n=1 Tax=unclassified Treponema TaxID=2638727 RepID=UPI0020A256FD|nr:MULTISPECIES: nucleoside-triphosphatase [unclassified Treponema]UTC66052.1 nucleoside-triphosphatase [Treponema sp. OMZ 789]UTC68782.1 nucleoside-triphosphatase [Treponema sp. OMZ 790]UTC71511.1 nucleoside-triphosphatase [Treponema sp. OMZ 791]